MKIGFVWDSDYPWDVRVEKVATTLMAGGHDVYIICRNQEMRAVYEKAGRLHIHRLPVITRNSRFLNSLLSFPAFFNVFWLIQIYRVLKHERIDYLIVRDLPLCPAALFISRIFKIPCAMDMAECYPELLRCIWKYEKFRFINIFVRNPFFADMVERYCVKRLDKIFVMIEESRERLLQMGVAGDKVVIVSNTPPSSLITSKASNRDNPVLTLLYLGILNPSRGLDTVIDGVSILKTQGIRCRLKIAGTGKARQALEDRVRYLGLDDSVEFLGWVDRTQIEKLLTDIDVGVVPHHVCDHWNSTIPNKLFDYMAAGIPVLSTNVIPMTRIIEGYDCGVTYVDPDPESFASSFKKLMDAELRAEFGRHGRQAIDQIFNWENDSKRLLSSLATY